MDSDGQLAAAAERLRQRALDHEAALRDGVTDIQPWDAEWLRQQIAECRATADLLDAVQTPAERLDQRGVTLRPDVYPIDRAIVAAQALAAAILGTQEATDGQ